MLLKKNGNTCWMKLFYVMVVMIAVNYTVGVLKLFCASVELLQCEAFTWIMEQPALV